MEVYGRNLLVSVGMVDHREAFEAMIRTTAEELRKWLERTGHVIADDATVTVLEDSAVPGAHRITVEFRAEAGGWSEVDDEVLRHCGQWRENRYPKYLWFSGPISPEELRE